MTEPAFDVLVDVVMATNRWGPFIDDTIDSVLGQTFSRWHLIVVADGSPEPERLAALAQKDLRIAVIGQRPAGVSAARNRGIDNGSAPYVAILDDDDTWAPDYLAKMVGALEREPEAVAAFSGGWYQDSRGVPFGEGWPAEQTPSRDFLRGAVPSPRIVALVVRRRAATPVGWFDESYRHAEDNEFIGRLLAVGEFVAVPEQLVGYRRHASNVSNARTAGRKADDRQMTQRLAQARKAGDDELVVLLREHRRRARAGRSSAAFADALRGLRRGQLSDAWHDTVWGLTHAPGAFLAGGARLAIDRIRHR